MGSWLVNWIRHKGTGDPLANPGGVVLFDRLKPWLINQRLKWYGKYGMISIKIYINDQKTTISRCEFPIVCACMRTIRIYVVFSDQLWIWHHVPYHVVCWYRTIICGIDHCVTWYHDLCKVFSIHIFHFLRSFIHISRFHVFTFSWRLKFCTDESPNEAPRELWLRLNPRYIRIHVLQLYILGLRELQNLKNKKQCGGKMWVRICLTKTDDGGKNKDPADTG